MSAYRRHLEATIADAAILHPDRAAELADTMGSYIADDYLGAVLEAAAVAAQGPYDLTVGTYPQTHEALVSVGVHQPGDGYRLLSLGPDDRWLHTERVDWACAELMHMFERHAETVRLVEQIEHVRVS